MGASDSKLAFKQQIFRVSEPATIAADDPCWTNVRQRLDPRRHRRCSNRAPSQFLVLGPPGVCRRCLFLVLSYRHSEDAGLLTRELRNTVTGSHLTTVRRATSSVFPRSRSCAGTSCIKLHPRTDKTATFRVRSFIIRGVGARVLLDLSEEMEESGAWAESDYRSAVR